MRKQLLLIASVFIAGVANAQYFSDDFSGGTLTGYTVYDVSPSASSLTWVWGTGGGADFAKMTNWNGTANEAVETWLVTPSINLSTSTNPTLNFDNTKRYGTNDLAIELDVFVSVDYDGVSDPTVQGTWVEITSMITLDTDVNSWAFTNSGNLDLSTVITPGANTRIAFKYTGTNTDGNTWEVDNINVTEGAIPIPDASITEIQNGTYATSETVNTGGIVTGVFDNGTDVGYFIQAGTGAYSGIYVDDAANVPSRGDSVTLTGTIVEAFGNTELGSIANFSIFSSNNAEPAATAISTADVSLEEYEGVKVMVSSATCLDPALGFGEWSVHDGSDTCIVDDLMYAYSAAAGNVYDVTGPIFFSYGSAKIEPRDANDIVGDAVEHTIYLIQNTTDPGGVSPYNGANVTVKGVVVAESSNAFNANDRGFWIMDGTGPWTGIYVWDSVNVVTRGDSVEVSAQVNENFNQTILRNVSNVSILNSGNAEPAASIIPSDSVNTEEYEGVLVTLEQAACINPNIGFGQWSINNATTDALVDDVMYEFLTPALGEAYTVTGVVYYTYNEYKVLPRDFNDVQTVTGLDELSNEVLEVYPNPTNGVINVNNNGQVVNVYNTVGQTVLSTTDSSFELTSGAYIVKVGSKVARVVVK